MNCKKFHDLLDELTDEQRPTVPSAVAEHAQKCPNESCRQAMEDFRRVNEFIATVAGSLPRVSLTERVMSLWLAESNPTKSTPTAASTRARSAHAVSHDRWSDRSIEPRSHRGLFAVTTSIAAMLLLGFLFLPGSDPSDDSQLVGLTQQRTTPMVNPQPDQSPADVGRAEETAGPSYLAYAENATALVTDAAILAIPGRSFDANDPEDPAEVNRVSEMVQGWNLSRRLEPISREINETFGFLMNVVPTGEST